MSTRPAPSRPRSRTAALALRAVLLAAAVGVAAPAARAQGGPSAAEIQSYRLTMPNVEKVVRAARNLKALENDADVKRWVEQKQAEAEREESASGGASGQDESFGKAVAMFREQPKIRRAIESTGLSVNDYFKTTLALGFAMMAHGVEKQAGTQQKAGTDVPGQNLVFVRQNEARLTALMAEMKKYEFKPATEEKPDAEGEEGSEEDPAR